MAAIVNERDRLLLTAASRTVAVTAPQVVVPGYTGISLSSDVNVWIGTGSPTYSPYRIIPSNNLLRETLSVSFVGMTGSPTVTWEIGLADYDYATGNYVAFRAAPVADHGIILSATGNSYVKTVDASTYLWSLPFPGTSGVLGSPPPGKSGVGVVRVSVLWGSTNFYSLKRVVQQTH